MTKLFQSMDHNLRRMMYLFIKEVAETCDPDDVIIGEKDHTLYPCGVVRVLPDACEAGGVVDAARG